MHPVRLRWQAKRGASDSKIVSLQHIALTVDTTWIRVSSTYVKLGISEVNRSLPTLFQYTGDQGFGLDGLSRNNHRRTKRPLLAGLRWPRSGQEFVDRRKQDRRPVEEWQMACLL